MELYSVLFFLFVGIFLLLHELIGKKRSEYQWMIKLAASICFYAYLAKWRVLFLLLSILSVWAAAVCMDKITVAGKLERKNPDLSRDDKKVLKKKTQKKKKLVLVLAMTFNLGILVAVRYVLPALTFTLILPLGISFYTFMAISYLVDVYGEKYEAEGNVFKIALYLSWFPQMIQGPINRFDNVRDSLFGESHLTYDKAKSSVLLFIYGALKKYAVANVLAPTVNEVFMRTDVSDIPGSFLLFTAFLYAIEQYADFSGGIDMVLGVSGLFGVKMDDNFRQPYFSKSVSEFWRRWHISLGAFLRDYVFYPFAMNSKIMKLGEKIRKRLGEHASRSIIGGIGNLLVFFLVGLWHGSELHYILWGLYNGLIIAVSDFAEPFFTSLKGRIGIRDGNKAFSGFQMLRTFIIIVFAGYFDAVSDVSNGFTCFKNTFAHFNASQMKPCLQYIYDNGMITDLGIISVSLGVLIILIISIFKENKVDLYKWISGKFIVIRWAVYYVLIFALLLGFAASGYVGGFMYAAF